MDRPPVELLVLDFDGVCTVGASELAAAGEPVETLAAIVRPEAEELVREAQELGVTTVVLSNEVDPEWGATVPVLAAVDRVVSCADNRIFKPDRRAFERCLVLTGCSALHTVLVDDELDCVRVAASLGIDAIHFDTADPAGTWAVVRSRLVSGPIGPVEAQ